MSSSITCYLGYALCFSLLVFVYKLWRFLYHHVIGHALGHTPDLRKFGKWCVVTGCTSGIGKSYTNAFAKLGLNVVLISRDAEKLQNMEKDLIEKYGVQVKVIVADFSTVSDKMFEKVKEGLKGLDIGILVNNVGAIHQVNKFCDIPNIESEIQRIININVVSHTMLTSMVLPRMAKKDSGLILFISSISAVNPMAQFQLYGSTKAYIDYFSRSLCEEYGSDSLIIQSVMPGPVCTNMLRSEPSVMRPTPDDYVKHQLRTIGISPRTSGYYAHEFLIILGWLTDILLPKKVKKKHMEGHMKNMKESVFSYQFDK